MNTFSINSSAHPDLITVSGYLHEGLFRIGRSGEIIWGNRSFFEILSLPVQYPCSSPLNFKRILSKDDLYSVAGKLGMTGYLRDEKLKITRADGKKIWVLVNCFAVTSEAVTFYDGSVLNIDEQHQTEILLQKCGAELEKLNREVDRFTYSIYHDLRSPVSSMKGLVNLMKMENASDRSNYITLLDKSLEKLDNFICHIAEYGKNNHVPLKSVMVSVSDIVNGVWNSLAMHPHRTFVSLSFLIEGESVFYADTDHLRVIIRNILINSLDFADLNKETGFVRMRVRHDQTETTIVFDDNGCGIPAGHVQKVFQMFYKASTTSKGVGLGLYLVKESVLKLGGNISIHSEYGVSTTICITIPNGIKGQLINKKHQLSL